MFARCLCVFVLALLTMGAVAQSAELPSRRAEKQQPVKSCAEHGAGFVWVAAMNSCMKIGGAVGVEYSVSPRGGKK